MVHRFSLEADVNLVAGVTKAKIFAGINPRNWVLFKRDREEGGGELRDRSSQPIIHG